MEVENKKILAFYRELVDLVKKHNVEISVYGGNGGHYGVEVEIDIEDEHEDLEHFDMDQIEAIILKEKPNEE